MTYRMLKDIPIFGDVEDGAIQQALNCRNFSDFIALMGDSHKGYGMPVGGIMASRELISPTAVGYDIACGNKAVLTNATAKSVRSKIKWHMDEVWKHISFGVGRNNNEEVDHELFDDEIWKMSPVKSLKDMARNQLGTVGSGVCHLAW